jgi:hypothetical protein
MDWKPTTQCNQCTTIPCDGCKKKVMDNKFFKGYRPQFYFRTTEANGKIITGVNYLEQLG